MRLDGVKSAIQGWNGHPKSSDCKESLPMAFKVGRCCESGM